MACNLTLHVNNILPHHHRFGNMPRVLDDVSTSNRLSDRQHIITITGKISALSHAHELLRRIHQPNERLLTMLRNFHINQCVWFRRRLHRWREGIDSEGYLPTIYVSYQGKLYPTHEARIRPHFGDLSLPQTPCLSSIDDDAIPQPDLPAFPNNPRFSPPGFRAPRRGRTPMYDLIHGIIVCSFEPSISFLFLPISPSSVVSPFRAPFHRVHRLYLNSCHYRGIHQDPYRSP